MSVSRAWRIAGLAVAAAIALAGLFIDPRTWLAAYLAVAVACTAVPVGALAVLMTTYLVRGKWTEGLHDPLAAAALTMPLAAMIFVPVLIGMPLLYPWVSALERHGPLQAIYLTPLFFVLRTIAYFCIWSFLALWTKAGWGDAARMTRVASIGLIVYALTTSFAAIDWIESLAPEMHSSIYGLLFIAFQLLAGLAFGILIALLKRGEPYRYGEILLSVMLLWAYLHAMQYIVIWAADIPEEAVWYLRREERVWGILMWVLILLQFVLPFFAMLSERVRYGRRPLMVIAATTLALRLVEACWLALPSTHADGLMLALDVAALAVIVGWLWCKSFALMERRTLGPAATLAH